MTKANRINLCNPVREVLTEQGYSTVKVVDAVNAALGQLDSERQTEAKAGDGRVTKSNYLVTVNQGSVTFKGARTLPLLFDAWHSAIQKANKIADFESVSIPSIFTVWLQKMKSVEKEEKAAK